MFWQVELVKDKATREPFIPADRYTAFGGDNSDFPVRTVLGKCLEKGVLLGGFVPNTLRIGASLTVSPRGHGQGARRAGLRARLPRHDGLTLRPDAGLDAGV